MRTEYHEGEKFVVIKSGKQLILKSVKDFDKNIEEDLEFAQRTEEAYKRYEKGEFKSMDFDEFITKMKQW